LLPILACKYEDGRLAIGEVMVLLKQFLGRRIDLFQATGVYENLANIRTIFVQHIEQLLCRDTVEITSQSQVQIFAVSVNQDLEIRCHGNTPFARLGISQNEKLVFSPNYW